MVEIYLEVTTRRNRKPQPRPRAYVALLNAHDSSTREAIAIPNNGKRIRVLRVRGVQETADGRHLYEVYFGTGADITADPSKAVETLDIPDLGQATTRTFLREEGSQRP